MHPSSCFRSFRARFVRLRARAAALAALLALAPAGVWAAPWIQAPGLTSGRSYQSAAVLPNGRVLVTGGTANSNGAALNLAEIYDPATGWSSAGTFTGARFGHSTTVLPNGKLLLAGGNSGGFNALNSALLYDPVAGTFSATGNLNGSRYFHSATLLPNGKVLVAGGLTSSNTAVASAELYDPATGVWSTTGGLGSERFSHPTVLLPNGKVLAVCGVGLFGTYKADAEIYDPATGLWSGAGSTGVARSQPMAALLATGKVLVAGGQASSNVANNTAVLYDPATNAWANTGNMGLYRSGAAAALLPNGKVQLAGGLASASANGTTLNTSTEIYDPAAGTWSAGNAVNGARTNHSLAALPNGRLVMVGGIGSTSGDPGFEFTDMGAPAWSGTGNLAAPRYRHAPVLLTNGRVLAAAGAGSDGSPVGTAELYNPATGTWSATGSMNAGRTLHTTTQLADGRVLLAGGADVNGTSIASAEIYDPASGTWSSAGTLGTARRSHAAALLPNGLVLVVGGISIGGSPLGSAELYDPASNSWSGTGSLTTIRYQHTCLLLPGGLVLVAGGNSGAAQASAELYDPAAGTWSGTGAMTAARYNHVATLLPGGKVLVCGGQGAGGVLASAEVYNPAAGTWSGGGTMTTGRNFFAAILLPNGRVLAGGGIFNGNFLASAETYDPASNGWTALPSMTGIRDFFGYALLPNGKVLAVGGATADGPVQTSELLDLGLGYTAATQPAIASASLGADGKILLTGSGFFGKGRSVHAPGQSPAGYPLVQLRWLDNGQTSFLTPDPAGAFSDTGFTSAAGAAQRRRPALLTVFGSAVPSVSLLLPFNLPGISTNAALPVASFSATLNGAVSSNGTATSVSFQYSTSPTLASGVTTTAVQNVGDGASNAPVSQSVTGLLSRTTYYYRLTGTNGAGTTVGPIVSFQTPNALPSAPNGTATGTTGDQKTVTVSFPATDADGDAVVIVGATGSANLTVNSFTNTTVTFTPASNVAGPATFTYTVSDGHGGTATGTVTVTVTDNDAPVVAAHGNVSVEATGPSGAVVSYAPGSATDNVTASPVITYSQASGTTFPLGGTTVTISATDAAGNVGTTTFTVTVTDTVPPETTLTSFPPAYAAATTAGFAFTGSDTVGVARFEGSLDGAPFTTVTSPAFLAGLGQGEHTFRVRAVDLGGNPDATPASRTWIVDTVPPSVTPPANVTAHATSPMGAIVTYPAAQASDANGIASLNYDRASGNTFPIGVTPVQVTATDPAGNATTVSFTVTVTPLTAVESWRYDNFGTADNSGSFADLADYDDDGAPNLLEFASGTDPKSGQTGPLQFGGTFAAGSLVATGLPTLRSEGADRRGLFVRRVDYAAAGLTYVAQFSANLVDWESSAVSPTVLAGNGAHEVVSVPLPLLSGGAAAKHFRVVVTIAP